MSYLSGRKSYRNEIKNLESQLELIDDRNLKHLVGSRIFWYRRKAQQNKKIFRLFSLLILCIQAAIAIISGFADSKLLVVVPLMAILVILIRGVIDLYHMQDNWKRYRATLEKMRDEVDMYLGYAGDYAGLASIDARRKLTERIIGFCRQENIQWNKQKHENSGPEDDAEFGKDT